MRLGDEILPLVERGSETPRRFRGRRSFCASRYRPGESLGTAFARLYARIFAEWGVIVLDASDGELDRVAEPMFRAAIERADELDAALLARGKALEAAGYHQQVKVTSLVGVALYHAAGRAHADSPPRQRRRRGVRDRRRLRGRETLASRTAQPHQFHSGTIQPQCPVASHHSGLSAAHACLHGRRCRGRLFRAGRSGL